MGGGRRVEEFRVFKAVMWERERASEGTVKCADNKLTVIHYI